MVKIALVVYDMRVSVLQCEFEPILKYKLRAPSDWGMQNVKFHDSVYTTPFSRTQTKSFMNIGICTIAYEDYPLFA